MIAGENASGSGSRRRGDAIFDQMGDTEYNGQGHSLYILLAAFRRNCRGVTAVEYGVIAALIIVVCIGAISSVGGQLRNVFDGL